MLVDQVGGTVDRGWAVGGRKQVEFGEGERHRLKVDDAGDGGAEAVALGGLGEGDRRLCELEPVGEEGGPGGVGVFGHTHRVQRYACGMEIDPSAISRAERYKLLIGGVVPRPIAFVSTMGVDGRTNLAPFSFFTAIGADPMMLMFCPANKEDGSEKDTLRNAKPVSEGGTGEFVVHIVSVEIAEAMAACAALLPYGESEFAFSGLTPVPSVRVKPPRVKECKLCFECETVQVIRTNPGAPGGGNVVIGRVVHVHADDGVLSERLHTDPAVLDALGRMGGPRGYCTTRDRLEVARGDEQSAKGGG